MRRPKVDYAVAEVLYRDGVSLTDIAGRFGVARGTIGSGLRLRGVPSHRSTKERKTPPETVLAYIAGLFDGEGHVCVVLSKTARISQYWLQVGITNTHRPVLDFVSASFGVGRINCFRKAHGNRLDCWRIEFGALDALHILRLLRPHLRVKAEVCDLAIQFQERMIEKNNDEWRQAMKEKITSLNRAS